MSEKKMMKLFLDICEALRYIHSLDIIHRDIKSPNVFITNDYKSAKLGDFGLCSFRSNNRLISTKKSKFSVVGTDCYLSPELHKKDVQIKSKKQEKS